ncbi:MAG: hypothetical protein ABUK01_02735 [Leptospirales bacterium]
MSPKYEFDETRDAIGADKLQDNERKAMLDKFQQGGGQVMSERELKQQKAERNRDKNRSEGDAKRRKAGGSKGGSSRGGKGGGYGAVDKKPVAPEKAYQGNFTNFILKFRSMVAGLTAFGGETAKPAFFSFLGLEVKQALVEFNLLGNDLFLQDREIGKKMARSLDNKSPILMEVLERMHSVFDSKEFNKLIEFNQSNPKAMIPFGVIDESIKLLYKRLYYLYPYQETLKKAFLYAVEMYKKESTDSNEKSLLDQKKKRFMRDVKTVFVDAFPKLFLLICRMDKTEYPPFSVLLEKAINVDQEQKLGKRSTGESSALASGISGFDEEGENSETDEETEEKEEEEVKENPILQTKEYQYGMKLMNSRALKDVQTVHDPKSHFSFLNFNDKAYLAYLFFMEFDTEMSFVLTTNKIQLNVDYSGGTKVDYKETLNDIYDESRNIIQNFEKYAETREEATRLEKQQGGNANYVEQSQRKEKAKTRMDMEGRNTRGTIQSYMDRVTRTLAILIADMKGEKKIVDNMDEALNFDSELEGSKRLNGQAVKQCILEAYCFSLALSYRLSEGDLFGGILEMTDEEMVSSFGKTYASGS